MRPYERENRRYLEGAQNKIEREELLAFKLLPKKRGKLLDVGCGNGEVTVKLKERGFEVYGVDFSSVAISMAKSKSVNAIVHDVDTGLPFKNGSFDVVWCGDILEHIFDPIFVLKEINRTLKDDGIVLITVPNELYLLNRVKVLLGKSPQSAIYRRFSQCKHHTIMSLELLYYFLDKSGFKVTHFQSTCKIPLIFSGFLSRKRLISSLFGRSFIVRLEKSTLRGTT